MPQHKRHRWCYVFGHKNMFPLWLQYQPTRTLWLVRKICYLYLARSPDQLKKLFYNGDNVQERYSVYWTATNNYCFSNLIKFDNEYRDFINIQGLPNSWIHVKNILRIDLIISFVSIISDCQKKHFGYFTF